MIYSAEGNFGFICLPREFMFAISVWHFSETNFSSYTSLVFEHSSHEEIDVSHPDFFSSAKLNGYTPPNQEVIFVLCCNPQATDILLAKDVALPQKHGCGYFCFLCVLPWMPLVVGKVVHDKPCQ
jgi:hypothetical protein